MFFINCNFGNANIVCNQPSASQVIFNNCANFFAYPPNATYVGLNVLSTGYSKNNISKTIDSTGSGGNSGDVLTSGGENGLDFWLPLPPQPPIPESGKCLENVSYYPRGQIVVYQNGSFQTTAITNYQLIGETYAIFEGTSISYQPPANTKNIIYSANIQINDDNGTQIWSNYSLWIDGNEVIISRRSEFNSSSGEYKNLDIMALITIDNTIADDDFQNGILKNWNSQRVIEIRGRSYSNYRYRLNVLNIYNGFANPPLVLPPLIKIQAYN
jgi:hypothetical protein